MKYSLSNAPGTVPNNTGWSILNFSGSVSRNKSLINQAFSGPYSPYCHRPQADIAPSTALTLGKIRYMLLYIFGFSLSWSASLSDSQEAISQKDTRAISSPTACHAGILARFLSLSGHVALRHMVHLDVGVLGEIKRRQVIEENDKENEKQAKKTTRTGSESTVNSTKVAKNGVKNGNDFFVQQLERN